jgi:hypothetical protein
MAPPHIRINKPDQSVLGAGTSVAPFLQGSSVIVAPGTAIPSIDPIDTNSQGDDGSDMALQPLSNQSGKRSYEAMLTGTSEQVPDSSSSFPTLFEPPTKLHKGKAMEHRPNAL